MRSFLGILTLVLAIPFAFSNEADLFPLINQYRIDQGLNQLIIEEKLSETAKKYALELIAEGRLSHTDRNGGRVLDRYRACDGTAVDAGEILGTSPEIGLILEAWKESPSHRQILLSPKWLRIGSSVIESRGNFVAVVLFSISQIASAEYEKSDGVVNIVLDSIDKRELIFPSYINSKLIPLNHTRYRRYELQITEENLPIVIPVSGVLGSREKMTDFLYIR